MTTSSIFEKFPGVLALSPEGKSIGYSRCIFELQGTLVGRLPALAMDYIKAESARCVSFCFISYLLERGLMFYVTSESVTRALESKNRSARFVFCDDSRRVWIAGEEWSEATLTIEALNAELVAMVVAAEKDQGLADALVIRL